MSQAIAREHHFENGRFLIGGFAATIVITMMMYFGAPIMTEAPMDIAGELARMLGVPWMLGLK